MGELNERHPLTYKGSENKLTVVCGIMCGCLFDCGSDQTLRSIISKTIKNHGLKRGISVKFVKKQIIHFVLDHKKMAPFKIIII